MRSTLFRTALVALLLCPVGVFASDWPQFLGPDRNGTAPGEKLARTWPAGGPKVLWTAKLGSGFAGPCIQGGKVYILDRVRNAQDVLRCLDLVTGKEDWTFAYDAPGRLDHNGSRSTPAVDDKYVFIIGPFGHFHCVDKKTHKPVWQKHLLRDFSSRMHTWGVAQSPLLHKGWVIVAPLSRRGAGVIAVEKSTGRIVWKSPAMGTMAYMSPRVTTIGGVEQVLMASKSHTGGVDIRDGKILWSYGGYRCSIPITSPTPLGDGRIFITGGYNAGSVMIKVQRVGEKFTVKELFRLRRLGAQIHPPVLHQDHLYVQFNTKSRHDGLVCIDLDGKVKWKTNRSPNFDWGGIVFADGVILIMDGMTGVLRMVQPDPKGYKELVQARILGGRQIWGPMALADGKLVLRDQRQIKCLDVGAK